MSSLYGILSTANFAEQLPLYLVYAFGAILLIAFLVGFVKGVRKVAWGGFYWIAAGVGFVFANLYMQEMNPFTKMFKADAAALANVLWTFTLALGCILIALILYGLFSAILRPRMVFEKAKYGYDGEEYDFDLEDDEEDDTPYAEETTMVIKGGGKPKFFGRLGGAFMCLVNTAAVLATLASIFIFVVDFSALRKGDMGAMFTTPIGEFALKYARTYAFDFFAIGFIFWVAYKGFHKGFFKFIYGLTSTFGVLVVVVLCFIIPFIKLGGTGIFGELRNSVAPLFAKFVDPFEDIFTKITTGALMAVVLSIAMIIVNFFLKKLSNGIKQIGFFRVIDGFLSLVLYLAIGVAVVALIWSVLYTLDYCDIFVVNDAVMEESVLAKSFMGWAKDFLTEFADKNFLAAKA